MAYLGKDNRITGSIGDLIFRNVDGKTIVQRKPEKYQVKQSKRTRKASSDFGRASTLAKKIRIGLQPYSRDFYDSKCFYRLRTQLQRAAQTNNPSPVGEKELWDGQPELLQGFEFNLHSKYSDYCNLSLNEVQVEADKLQFTLEGFIPKEDIRWPRNAQKAIICFWISVHRRKDDLPVNQQLLKLEVTPHKVALGKTTFTSEILPAEGLVWLWGGILYYEKDPFLDWIYMNHKQLQPLQLLRVMKI